MKRCFTAILFFTFFFFCLISSATAQETKRIGDISSVTLVIYEHLGAISGYIIFRDNNGKKCAIDYYEEGWLICQAFEKSFKIRPSDFEYITLRSGDKVFAYPIREFTVDNLYENYGGKTLNVKFKLGTSYLEATDSLSIPSK
jgi:hypothetical protein